MEPKGRKIYISGLVAVCGLIACLISYVWERAGGATPCPFCVLERIFFGIGGGMSALTYGLHKWVQKKNRPRIKISWLFLCTGGVWIVGSAFSFQHTGVQYGWFPVPFFCEVAQPYGETLEEMTKNLLNLTATRCDQVMASFFGQPLPLYIFLLMFFFALTFLYLGFFYRRKGL